MRRLPWDSKGSTPFKLFVKKNKPALPSTHSWHQLPQYTTGKNISGKITYRANKITLIRKAHIVITNLIVYCVGVTFNVSFYLYIYFNPNRLSIDLFLVPLNSLDWLGI